MPDENPFHLVKMHPIFGNGPVSLLRAWTKLEWPRPLASKKVGFFSFKEISSVINANVLGLFVVMWPLLTDLKSVVAIGKKEVATCGYLIPLIYSLANDREDYPSPAEGPSCVILCPSHSVVERVWKTLKWLTRDVLFLRDEITVNVLFENEYKMAAVLANGRKRALRMDPSRSWANLWVRF